LGFIAMEQYVTPLYLRLECLFARSIQLWSHLKAPKLTSHLKLVIVVSSAISASVNSYRFGLLKIRSKTNGGVPKLFSSVMISPTILWTPMNAASQVALASPCPGVGKN
jgi:hypothetical protein